MYLSVSNTSTAHESEHIRRTLYRDHREAATIAPPQIEDDYFRRIRSGELLGAPEASFSYAGRGTDITSRLTTGNYNIGSTPVAEKLGFYSDISTSLNAYKPKIQSSYTTPTYH